MINVILKCTGCGHSREIKDKENEQVRGHKTILCEKCYMPMVVDKAGGILCK